MQKHKEGLVLLLLREGSRHHAIQLYREESGVGFHEAEEFVTRLARRHGITSSAGGVQAAVFVLLALLIGIMCAF